MAQIRTVRVRTPCCFCLRTLVFTTKDNANQAPNRMHTPRMPRTATWRYLQRVRATATTVRRNAAEDGRAWIRRTMAEEEQGVPAT